LKKNLELLVRENRLLEVPGIGAHLAEKVSILVLTGHLPYYEELKSSFPDGLLKLFTIPGLEGKKIKVLHEELGIKSIDELYEACRKGRLPLSPILEKRPKLTY